LRWRRLLERTATLALDLKNGLTAARERLLRAIAGVTEEQFKRRPEPTADDPQPWCIAEVLAHLLADEREWAERIALGLREDGAHVESRGPGVNLEQARIGRQVPVPQLIHGLLACQRELRRLIDEAERLDAFNHGLDHATRGRISVAWMLQAYGFDHELEHAAQIEALRLRVGAQPVAAPR
jgi:uncharacterized damage-inducible protein DinB